MTLGRKTLAIVAATVSGSVLIAYILSSRIMLNGFRNMQEEDTLRNLQRTTGALSNDLHDLSKIAGDWGRWKDTYAFMMDRNQSYIKSNLIRKTFTEHRLDHILYLDRSGRLVYAAGYDLCKDKSLLPSDPINKHIADKVRSIRTKTSSINGMSGVDVIDHFPMMIAAYPILGNNGSSHSRGAIIMSRHLDAAQVNYLANTARVQVGIRTLNDPNLPQDYREARYALKTQKTHVQLIDAVKSIGYTALMDIQDRPAVILRVDTSSPMLRQGQVSLNWLLISTISMGVLFAIVSALIMQKAVLERLAKISSGLKSIGRTGDLSARLAVTGRDELSDAVVTINWMLDSLSKAHDELEERVIDRTAELARARESLQQAYEHEHRIAEVLQKSLIEPVDSINPEFEIAARYQPALAEAEVGGDFYDVFSVSEDRTAVVIGDVAGKGLGAAILTAMAKYMLRAYAHDNPQPGEVLWKLNDALCDYTPADAFITLFLGILDPSAGTFTYASAGHDYPLFFSAADGQVTQILSTGTIIGHRKEMCYDSNVIELAPGDTLLLYTDGITDARDSGPPLGIERLSEVFQTVARAGSQRIADAVFDAAANSAQGHWPDDAAVLVVKIGPVWRKSPL